MQADGGISSADSGASLRRPRGAYDVRMIEFRVYPAWVPS